MRVLSVIALVRCDCIALINKYNRDGTEKVRSLMLLKSRSRGAIAENKVFVDFGEGAIAGSNIVIAVEWEKDDRASCRVGRSWVWVRLAIGFLERGVRSWMKQEGDRIWGEVRSANV